MNDHSHRRGHGRASAWQSADGTRACGARPHPYLAYALGAYPGSAFFAPLFVSDAEWHIYGPRGIGKTLQVVLAAQMDYSYFPITLNAFTARLHYHEVVEGGFSIEGIRIATHYLNHPALTVGYRLEVDGASIVYASDHEPYTRSAGEGLRQAAESGDSAQIEFMRGADLVIHDTQYTATEYRTKIAWGHSTIEYAVDVAIAGQVRKLALYDHDPNRTDDAGSDLSVVGAAEGNVIELRRAAHATKGAAFVPAW